MEEETVSLEFKMICSMCLGMPIETKDELTLLPFDNLYTFIIASRTGYASMDKPTDTIFATPGLITYT